MNTKDNAINDSNFKKLINNDNYYRHIFKKTEKIISVVFYIINNTDTEKKTETLISLIASKAHFAHENALRTLEVKPVSSKEVLEQFAQSLVGLDSTLRISAAANIISGEVLQVMVSEIDTVIRGLRTFIHSNTNTDELMFAQSYPSVYSSDIPVNTAQREKRKQVSAPTDSPKSAPSASDRRERIKTILEAKGEATIKDISEIITDVSEKTIQRELNAMIEENLVKRQGERRWSKYSIF